MARQKKHICLKCCTQKRESDYIKSRGKIVVSENGFVPICKDCASELYKQYFEMVKDESDSSGIILGENQAEKAAIERMCMLFDIYFSSGMFDAALKSYEKQEDKENTDLWKSYVKIMNLRQNQGKSYDNTIIERTVATEMLTPVGKNELLKLYEEQRNQEVDSKNELYRNLYELCLKTLEALKGQLPAPATQQ